jgi:signal transduction histidine kinase
MLLLYFLWKLDKQKKKAINQAEALHAEQLKTLHSEQKSKLYDSVLTGEEQERTRLARELHDGVGSMLASFKWKLTSADNLNSNAQIISSLDDAIEELRRVSRNMLPASLLYMDLETALRDLCQTFDSDVIRISFQPLTLHGDYDKKLSAGVYRIVQELLNNAIKHAAADLVIVQCGENNERLCITVEDNGTGIPGDRIIMSDGIGLANVRNRVELYKGSFEIETSHATGTTIYIELPIVQQ